MWKSKTGYYRNRHSCFLLRYHLVLITKYRHEVIKEDLEISLREYTESYYSERGLPLLALETMPDHIHILFEAPPQINLASFVNAYKSASSRYLRKTYKSYLTNYFWKPYFWSQSYFIASVGDNTVDVVKKYIENQKQ